MSIIDLDPNRSSGPSIRSAVEANGYQTQHVTSVPPSIGVPFNPAAFVCLGVFNENNVLQQGEAVPLAAYLDRGGRL